MLRLRSALTALFSLIFFFFSGPFYLVQQLGCRLTGNESFLGATPQFLQMVYAQILISLDEGLRSLFPAADAFDEEIRMLTPDQIKAVEESADYDLNPDYDSVFRFYAVRKGGEIIGYAAEDTEPGKWGSIRFLTAWNPDGSILDVVVLEYQEKRGRPVAEKRFLKQFRGKHAGDAIRIMRDIRGVTGASISSNGVANGVRKMTHIFKVLYGGSHA